jgi:phosphoglycolate phosphatase
MKPSHPGEPWRPKAVIFDFDGTLADSYSAITATVNHVRAHHGLPPMTAAEVRRFVGHGPAHLLTHTVPGADLKLDVPIYRSHHRTVMRDGTRLMPGAREVITALAKAGVHLAVCSNKPVAFTRDLLDFLGLAPYLDLVLGPEDVPRPKPAPDMLLAALLRIGTKPDQTLYVGDMIVDIDAARRVEIPVWVVPTGSDTLDELAAARPDRILHNLLDILTLWPGKARG